MTILLFEAIMERNLLLMMKWGGGAIQMTVRRKMKIKQMIKQGLELPSKHKAAQHEMSALP